MAGSGPQEPVRSIRNSRYGYTNHTDVNVSYASLETYLADIAELVETGKLSEEKEFYAPVRLRGGQKVADLATAGIRYIELRNIDINPFEMYGISQDQVKFLHLFLLYLATKEEGADADAWVEEGNRKNNQVALEHPLNQTIYLEEAKSSCGRIDRFCKGNQSADNAITGSTAANVGRSRQNFCRSFISSQPKVKSGSSGN